MQHKKKGGQCRLFPSIEKPTQNTQSRIHCFQSNAFSVFDAYAYVEATRVSCLRGKSRQVFQTSSCVAQDLWQAPPLPVKGPPWSQCLHLLLRKNRVPGVVVNIRSTNTVAP